ncbi:MAG: bifunctional demethylmenaquinone methyltransferase/2-methoxy-6-polyprenyl-1,4-benzoquinol methylase UbiE [Rhizobiales bacterium]|nr:bifunctional demethylmenaquinone methyltransferase/2-methoxy-6-polyprenyl-1,4-benzoquinol methylase UbiE [Hyphomicrobiales bacterium]
MTKGSNTSSPPGPEHGQDPGPQAHFGFQTVDEAEKQGRVNDVFSKVAEKYDQMNDLMSGGLHRLWKDAMIDWLSPPRGDRAFNVLDVAGGTGDISFRIADEAGCGTQMTVCDINHAMVTEGRKRARKRAYDKQCRFTVGNAEALPFEDGGFDAYTIAFGIRNVTHIDRALEEAFRVLKPGGRFLCLEFSKVDIPGLDTLYDAYSFTAVPAIGKVVTGDGPYRYLVESIRKFPDQDTFKHMMSQAGFSNVKHRNMSGGIVALHSGWKI